MIRVKRLEFDFPTAKHFPNAPKKDVWQVHFKREFRSKLGLLWDKIKNPDDYKVIDTIHTPVPILIFTVIDYD